MPKQRPEQRSERINAAGSAGLPRPCRYFPLDRCRYDIKPGLFALGTDFGCELTDRKIIQLDDQYHAYRREKLAARAESLEKYYRVAAVAPALGSRIAEFLARRAAADQAEHFTLNENTGASLECRLSGETLVFDPDWSLASTHCRGAGARPPYVDALDALACQFQEDIAVVGFDRDGDDRLIALHLCLPNYWAAEDKIGLSFDQVHAPVPGMAQAYRRPQRIVRAMSEKGPCVRFAWGLTTDVRLNHHPRPAPGAHPERWHGRSFDPAQPRLYLRVERQVLWGLGDAALFLIRTYITDCDELSREERGCLHAAVAGMSREELRYKGLEGCRDAVLDWLQAGSCERDPAC